MHEYISSTSQGSRTHGIRRPHVPPVVNSQMRHPARLLLTGAALLVATACNNDSSVAPLRGAPPTLSGSSALAALATSTRVDFVIPAAGGRVSILGIYMLDVPANAVCDPSAQDTRDGYAAAAWNAPCTVATTGITVHATLQWSHNRMWADFSPSLRFAPGKTVTLSTGLMSPIVRYYADANGGNGSNGLSRKWGILFAPSIDAPPVDDAKDDASIRTTVDFTAGTISRRVKHFTGYSILTGAVCVVDLPDPYCVASSTGP
jgi:hypothetical protein